ncbi:MAG: hypothetical protein PHE55_12935 [Methylococcaceae bacterium]|nr:hypothetical protein [Methylococcaceae bacterium]
MQALACLAMGSESFPGGVPNSEIGNEVKALPLAPLMPRDAETRDTLRAYLESHRLDPSQVKFLPLRAKKRDQTVIIDAANGAVLGIVDLDPWQPGG